MDQVGWFHLPNIKSLCGVDRSFPSVPSGLLAGRRNFRIRSQTQGLLVLLGFHVIFDAFQRRVKFWKPAGCGNQLVVSETTEA